MVPRVVAPRRPTQCSKCPHRVRTHTQENGGDVWMGWLALGLALRMKICHPHWRSSTWRSLPLESPPPRCHLVATHLVQILNVWGLDANFVPYTCHASVQLDATDSVETPLGRTQRVHNIKVWAQLFSKGSLRPFRTHFECQWRMSGTRPVQLR